jgi:hypothetical protein
MISRFTELSKKQRQAAMKLLYLERRARALSIYRLLAQARIGVCRVVLKALEPKEGKESKPRGAITKEEKARQRRVKYLNARLQKSIRHLIACENTGKRVLIRRVLTRIKFLEETRNGHQLENS